MTKQEKANKKEAKRLIKLVNKPDNVLVFPPEKPGWATHYRVQFGNIEVCFMHTGKQLVYLGEYLG